MNIMPFFMDYFWGIVLLLLGISIILHTYGITIPIMRFVLAFILIWLGIGILLEKQPKIFKRKKYVYSQTNTPTSHLHNHLEKNYSLHFSDTSLDLRNATPHKTPIESTIEILFSQCTIHLPPVPTQLIFENSFSNVTIPQNKKIKNNMYESNPGENPSIILHIDAQFSSITIHPHS